MFFWPLRITASTADSHSVNRSSILLGAIDNSLKQHWFGAVFFVLNETLGIELRKERLQKGEQCAAFLQFAARDGGKSECRRRRRRKQEVFDCRASILLGAINNNFETALVLVLFFCFK